MLYNNCGSVFLVEDTVYIFSKFAKKKMAVSNSCFCIKKKKKRRVITLTAMKKPTIK